MHTKNSTRSCNSVRFLETKKYQLKCSTNITILLSSQYTPPDVPNGETYSEQLHTNKYVKCTKIKWYVNNVLIQRGNNN